jgi:hypothetical protein
MSRAYTPGGRFNSDFEINAMQDGIDADLKNPVGTNALWFIYDPGNTIVDPIYETASQDFGKAWRGPYSLPVVRAVISQGKVPTSQRGFYSADTLHLTLNGRDIDKIDPGVLGNPDLENRGRILWKNQLYRPFYVQQRGIVSETFTLVVVDCIQVSSEEMVNDFQFLGFVDKNPRDPIPNYDPLSVPPPIARQITSPIFNLPDFINGGNPSTEEFEYNFDGTPRNS